MKKTICLWMQTSRWALGVVMLFTLLLVGCQTGYENVPFTNLPPTGDFPDDIATDDVGRFAKDDQIRITFSGTAEPIPPHEERIKEDGSITLPHIGAIQAEGKTYGELQRDIVNAYVPNYYKRLTVTISSEQRVYFVSGQVRQPGRSAYIGATTVLKAITSAGDFTDFADRKRVTLTRADGRRQVVNCIAAAKDASLDPPVFPGDTIEVPLRRPIF